MLNRTQSIGLGVLVFAAGLWLGSIEKTSAQVSAGARQNMRFMLSEPANDGGLFMIDTTSGETWALVMGDATPAKKWVNLGGPRSGG